MDNTQISELLKDLPANWRETLTKLLCQIKESRATLDCAQVKECETVTALSNFSVDGTVVTISYNNEAGQTVPRSFDVEQLLNSQLETVEPGCLTDETSWSNMNFTQKVQLLVDSHCDCCEETTTTSTTTTTTV